MKKHISFSELKTWNECAYKHKLSYIEQVREFIGNEYTAFGKAVHDTCEKSLISKKSINQIDYFNNQFLQEIESLVEEGIQLKPELVQQMRIQAKDMLKHILPEVKNYFGEYEVISTEEQLYEPMEGIKYNFKGYIDLVLKTKDGRYHIIDWKTCSWGWDFRRKNDSMTTYQLTLYKHFFALKHNIDPENINTHFALLKRTSKKDKVEIFKVTSGPKKTQNCLKLLNKAVYNIRKKRYIKNRLSCTQGYGCEFYNTKFCRR